MSADGDKDKSIENMSETDKKADESSAVAADANAVVDKPRDSEKSPVASVGDACTGSDNGDLANAGVKTGSDKAENADDEEKEPKADECEEDTKANKKEEVDASDKSKKMKKIDVDVPNEEGADDEDKASADKKVLPGDGGDDQKTDNKEKNGTVVEKTKKTKTDAESALPADDTNDNDADDKEEEDDENVVALAEIDKINENINKTRVDGLQTLHTICFGSQGKNNVVKRNLRSFAGFEFEKDTSEYKKKFESIKKVDTKSLKSICEILSLERKGTKDEIASRVLKFLLEPDESMCVEPTEEEDEEMDDEEAEEGQDQEDEEDEPSADDKRKRKAPPPRTQTRNSSGRPRRTTAGKKMSAYVDFSSSDESERKVVPTKRRRNDDSESGSDYNPSGNSDTDGGKARKMASRGGTRGRPSRKSRRRNSDSEEEESELSDAESDVPKRSKRSVAAGKRGRPATSVATTRGRGRAASAAKKGKRKDSESEEELSEEEDEEELTDVGSEQSDDDEKRKKMKKPTTPARNIKANNKPKAVTTKAAGRPKKPKKESSVEEDDDKDESEDEPLNKKGKTSFPTDDQIRSYVKEILDKANLEEITMKTVCKQVYARYPDFDLTDKKEFIKATVKALIAA